MPKCGICLAGYGVINCAMCNVYACFKCINYDKYGNAIRLHIIQYVCKFCFEKLIPRAMLSEYKFCMFCENVYSGTINCASCSGDNTSVNSRVLLPNHKALPIIEAVYNIKGIAKIIFDYYYKPRRYFESEM